MTTQQLVTRMFLSFPAAQLTKEVLAAYVSDLSDCDPELIELAIRDARQDRYRLRRDLHWPPSPDEIRRYLPRVYCSATIGTVPVRRLAEIADLPPLSSADLVNRLRETCGALPQLEAKLDE